jgi:hypothetical protein
MGKRLLNEIFFKLACDIENLPYVYFCAEPYKISYFMSIGKKIYTVFETLPDLLSFLHWLI